MLQGNLTYFTFDRFGDPTSALYLNGGYTQVPSGSYLNSPQFTVSAWVYPSQVGDWARFFDFANPGILDSDSLKESIQFSFTSYQQNNPAFVIYNQTTFIIEYAQSNISLEQNKWNFLTLTFNGSLFCLYINGTLTNTSQFNGQQIPQIQRTSNFFGRSNLPGDGVSWSLLDDIRFFNISLNQTQIINLMNDISNNFSACPSMTALTITNQTQSLKFDNITVTGPKMTDILLILANSTFDLNGCLRNCTNRGICLFDNKLQAFGCLCDPLFGGNSCQIDRHPCSNNQCLHNGLCMSTYMTSQCQCGKSFNGTNCEIYLDVCDSEKCSNNGHCWIKGNNDMVCKCYVDYNGKNCENGNTMRNIIKYVRVSSLTLFLSTICTFCVLIVANDVVNLFCKKSRRKTKEYQKQLKDSQVSIRYRFMYHNN